MNEIMCLIDPYCWPSINVGFVIVAVIVINESSHPTPGIDSL